MRLDVPRLLAELPLRLADAHVAPVVVRDDDEDSAVPADLRAWLTRLRLLEGVPFASLVPDSALLPPESVRWFWVDRQWTDALVQGALSVGTVGSDDRTALDAQYPAVREELDREERNARRRPGAPRLTGPTAPVSGFLLRSRVVSGWPGLHVRAFSTDPPESDAAPHPEEDPRRMRLLRLERLAPAVLLCLFDGVPQVVHLEEPRQGVQFGFDVDETAGGVTATLPARRESDGADLPGRRVDVRFRTGGGSGVVDVQALERSLAGIPGTGAGSADAGLDSAEYALQLVRFPYRQVYGEDEGLDLDVVFSPRVSYADLVDASFRLQP